jgi:hypothetical protein
MAASEQPTCSNRSPEWEENLFPSKPFRLPKIPPVGILIDQIARQIVVQILKGKSGTASHDQANLLMLEARNWIGRAEEVGLDQAPSAEDMGAFEKWLQKFSQPNELEREPPSPHDRDAFTEWFHNRPILSKLRCEMPRMFTSAMKGAITFLAGSPTSAALIPDEFYDAMENYFLPFHQRKYRPTISATRGKSGPVTAIRQGKDRIGTWDIGSRVHQMLGHAPASQHAMSVDSDTVGLLQLTTDDAVNMMFGDVGEAAFWIRAEDLINRRFDAAWVTLQGG